MDQAELLAVISGMYDKLVTDVAERVLVKIDATIAKRMAAERAELEEIIAARTVSSDDIEEQIATWVDQHLDIENDIDRYMSNGFDINDYMDDIGEKVNEALDEVDWKEKVNEALNGSTIQLV